MALTDCRPLNRPIKLCLLAVGRELFVRAQHRYVFWAELECKRTNERCVESL